MWDIVQPIVKEFIITLTAGVLAVLSGFIIALVKKGFDWVSEKISNMKNEEHRRLLINATENLQMITETTVRSLQQTLASDIKESIKNDDGKYTREDLLALKDKAVETILTQLSQSSQEALSSVYTDLRAYVGDLVESTLLSLKTQLG